MSEVSFDNRDLFLQIGITIATLRKIRGMSQDDLAEKANISRSFLSTIEAPAMVVGMKMDSFVNIAKALDISPSELMNIAERNDQLLTKKE